MERAATREDAFHNQSLNQIKPQFSYIDHPSIIRAQLPVKPASRDVSFSSYLKPNDPLLPTPANHPGHRAEDSEISIFDAEKYFNGVHAARNNNNNNNNEGNYTVSNLKQPEVASIGRLSSSTPKQSVSSISRLSSVSDDSYGRNYRARSFHATPTATSEASWNSQTGLLTNPPGLAPVSIRNLPSDRTSKKTGASMKWFLRANRCPCSGKKSVIVEESNSERETSKTPPPPPRMVQLNRISSGGGGSLYSTSRQRSPKTLANPVRGTTRTSATITRATLIPDEPIRDLIARPQLDQNKLILTDTNPNLDGLHRDQGFPPDHVAVTVRSFAEGSGATSNGFTFPILSNSAAPPKRTFNIAAPPVAASTGDTPRDSLEVFQPRDGGEGRNFTFPASPKSRNASYDDEMCSDASSDLFEIESLSTTSATQTTLFPRRESLDDPAATFNVRRLQIAALTKPASSLAVTGLEEEDEEEPVTPSIAPTECYPPSEVSVDWSVTTAEGFDRASLASFSVTASEAGYPALREATKGGSGDGASGGGESRRRANVGLLTSCRCEKAVSVGPGPVKCQAEGGRGVPAIGTRGHVGGRAH